MSKREQLALELANGCLEDLYVAYGNHIAQCDYKAAAQCGWRIKQTVSKIKRLQEQLDKENYDWVLKNLRERGLGNVADKIVQAQQGGEQLAHQN